MSSTNTSDRLDGRALTFRPARDAVALDTSMSSDKYDNAEQQHKLLEQATQVPTQPPDEMELNRAKGLPVTGFLRLHDIIGRAATKTSPAIPAIIPVSSSTWWVGVRSGRFPQPTRELGPRITAWSVESILALIEKTSISEAL